MKRSDKKIVGWYETRQEVIVYREPEVGIAWMAEAFNRAGSGKTPAEAVRNLFKALTDEGYVGQGYADDAKLAKIE